MTSILTTPQKPRNLSRKKSPRPLRWSRFPQKPCGNSQHYLHKRTNCILNRMKKMLTLSLSLINGIIFLKKISGRTHMSIEQISSKEISYCIRSVSLEIYKILWQSLKITLFEGVNSCDKKLCFCSFTIWDLVGVQNFLLILSSRFVDQTILHILSVIIWHV